MCTLAFCHERKMTKEEFENCDDMNGDGIGFAFNKGGKQYYAKGFMDFESAWEFYEKVPENKAHIVHFRMGTAGGNVPELTHPFICTETSPLHLDGITEEPLLFHNGMISNWKKEAKLERVLVHNYMSDTRMLAILTGKYGMENFKSLFKKSDGKFIILYKGKAKMYGDFIYEKGIYFSNTHYKYSMRPYSYNKAYWERDLMDDYYVKYNSVKSYYYDDEFEYAREKNDNRKSQIEKDFKKYPLTEEEISFFLKENEVN